jgi:HEAT repeat protein
MDFGFKWISQLGPAGFVVEAIFATLAGIGLLLAFILARRAWRRRLFRRRDERVLAIRKMWPQILSGAIPYDHWRLDPLDCEIVETILLDLIEITPPEEAGAYEKLLRESGLMDLRIHQARARTGWRRRQALVSLGRMRLPEVIPVLAEGLDARDTATRMAAVRGLGRLGLPEAAVPMLERIVNSELKVPATPLQNALLGCLRWRPTLVLPYLRRTTGETRAMLARVLGEVATGDLGEDILLLVADTLPDVRASAARSLADAPRHRALSALSTLAADSEWFVRLRAVVSLGQLRDPAAIPVLVDALCDRNRLVRLRAAAALSRLTEYLDAIFSLVRQKRDRYALQALLSEVQRSGTLLETLTLLRVPEQRQMAESVVLAVVRAGAYRLLLSALLHHRDWRVRTALARLLAKSQEASLLGPLEDAIQTATVPRQRRIAQWVLDQLRGGLAARRRLELVPA